MTEVRTTSSTGGQKGVKLQRFDLIPIGPLRELAIHYGRGAKKYDDHQWRQGYEWSKSYAAIQRHLTDFWDGKDFDVCSNDPDGCSDKPFEQEIPDTCYNHTGSHHLVAAAWHSFTLLELKETHPQHDDRYKRHVEQKVEPKVCGHFSTFMQLECVRRPGHTDFLPLQSVEKDLHWNPMNNTYWEDER